jgi:transglutaminase-like putative cysteine protease
MKRWSLKSILLQDWYDRLTALLTGIFLLQYVEWIAKEEYVWLPQTQQVVRLTLLIVFIVELFTRLHWGWRRLAQFIGIFVALGAVVHYDPVGRDMHPVSEFGSWISDLWGVVSDNFIQLTPFIWFALSAWAISLLAYWAFKVKWLIMVVLICSVAAFAFRDSFSLIVLWLQVAVMITCGLFLLIIRHFAGLKQKSPTGWAQLSDYPVNVSLPIVFIVSLVIFIGTLMPDVRAVVMDPYTMWKNFKGEQITFFNKGFGTSAAIGGESSSGYSRNDSALGGEFSFDYTPVMTVSTSHASYWRGETRSLYTGRGWILGDTERRSPLSPVALDASMPYDARLPAPNVKTVDVTQTVTILKEAPQEYPVLFGAYSIDSVQNVGSAANVASLQWASRLSELRWLPNGRQSYPQTYSITSKVPIVDETELRHVPGELTSRAGLEEFLFVPESLPERVRLLAQQVTANGTNMYDKVKLLEKYLSTTYPYTNTPDLSKGGRSRDFVDRFLFEIKEGYCDYYSTAMAIMARTLGIPSRWVKGYTTGTSNLIEDMSLDSSMLDGPGDYTIRNSDAHSWVEIYFPGYGWIPFEPTAGFALPVFAPEPEISTELLPAGEDVLTGLTTMGDVLTTAISWVTGIIAAAIVLLLMWFNRSAIRELLPIRFLRQSLDANQKTVLEFERLIRFAKRKGYTRSEHETAREMMFRWIERNKWLQKDMDSLLSLFEKAKYSGLRISDEELSSVSRIVSKLREEM